MKRCPRCNQEFTDEWLTFCTQDGTSLVEVEVSPNDPPPTLVRPPMPPSVSPTEQPTLDMPGRHVPPPVEYIPPPPMQSGWTPPPPPPYPTGPQTGMAVTSMILGIASITLGLCCYFGILTAPVALVLGIMSLVQIKNTPNRYGGKGMAIAGIIMGALYFVILVLIMLLYGIGIFLNGIG
jgi:uncharacterized membrane protein YphA (DoxX/SURF4 family)